MKSKLSFEINELWGIKEKFRMKIFFLALTFSLMTACFVIWHPLKQAIFAKMVGAAYVPEAKLYSLFVLIPLILLYSKMVDWLRRHQLLYFYILFHGLGGLIFYFILSHPVYGISNTVASYNRLMGWAFYFFMESFDAFFAATFWSFVDSINNPKDAKNYYGFIVSGSKIGGVISAGILYFVMTINTAQNQIALLPGALLCGSALLLAAAASVFYLMKKVPENFLHGYEQAYQLEKHRKPTEKFSLIKTFKSSFNGLFLMLKHPYVLGIFALVMCAEIINVIFDWRVMLFADASNPSVGSLTAYYAFYYLVMNSIGLFISIFGTTPIVRVLGIQISLFIFPVVSFLLMVASFFFPSAATFFWVYVALKAFNFAFNHPTREALYIPTTKEIKFKAKTWTDAFGGRLARSSGSIFNLSIKGCSANLAILSSLAFCMGLTAFWIVVTYFLGRTLQSAIEQQKVIGEENDEPTVLTIHEDEETGLTK
jgi:AAA family ATP:ADP antiporter